MYGDDSNDYPPELVIDLDNPGESDEVRVENHFMVNASMNEFRANQKFMAVPKNNVQMVKNKIRKKSKSPPQQSLLLAKGPSMKKVQKNDQDIVIENVFFEKDDEDETPLSSVENTNSRLNSARGTLSNVLKLNQARGSLSNALTGAETSNKNQESKSRAGSKTVALLSKLSSQETLGTIHILRKHLYSTKLNLNT